MDRSWLNSAKKLTYIDPQPVLLRFAQLNNAVAESELSERVRRLRTNELKHSREARSAALFCHGMSERLGHKIYFSPTESSDHDFIASWIQGDEQHFVPVQLKELAPADLNPRATLNDLLMSLEKYGKSPDLTVAIHWNRDSRVKPDEIHIPKLGVGSLWLFACISADQMSWALTGDFMTDEIQTNMYRYPERSDTQVRNPRIVTDGPLA